MADVMTEPVEKPQNEDSVIIRVIAEKVPGEVKWYNMEKRYGFIQREDVDEDVFVHRSGILKYKNTPCLWKGLKVEFSVVETSKGIKAESVTGPNGEEIARRRVRRSIRNQEEGGGDGEYRRQRRGPGRPRPGNEETDGTFYDPMGPYSRSRNRPDENGDQEEELPNIRGGRRGRGRPRGGRGMRSYGQGGGDIDEQYAEENYQNGENNGMAPGPRIRHRRPRVRRNDLNIQEGDNACPEGTVFNINGINKSERRGIPRRRGNRGGGYMRGRGHGGLADPVESTAGEISNEDQSNAVALPAAASD